MVKNAMSLKPKMDGLGFSLEEIIMLDILLQLILREKFINLIQKLSP